MSKYSDLLDLQARYRQWMREREDLAEADATANPPSSSQWENSDDAAVDLMHEAMALLAELTAEPSEAAASKEDD
jgi:hypothetical protein